MALGGGVFLTQNKVMPGAYINFVALANASAALSDRGVVIYPMALNWGAEGAVTEITASEFIKNCVRYTGVPCTDDSMKALREVFLHATKVLLYNLCGSGAKASNTGVTAKYAGTAGNKISIVTTANGSAFDVEILMDGTAVEKFEALTDASTIVSNYAVFTSDFTLTAGTVALENGTTGAAATDYTAFFAAADSYTFNAMAIPSTTTAVINAAIAYVRDCRENQGKKFQIVIAAGASETQALGDYEGVVSVKNGADLVPWVTGVVGGVNINKSATNMAYDGEYTVNTNYTQSELENFIKKGYFVFHAVNGAVKVLRDINSMVTTTAEKSADFGNNQVIRVLDQIANDIAVLFATKYLGKIQNNKAGRISLWGDIVKHHQAMQTLGAIEDFEADDITVEAGESKTAVVVTDNVAPVAAMEKLYMTVYVA